MALYQGDYESSMGEGKRFRLRGHAQQAARFYETAFENAWQLRAYELALEALRMRAVSLGADPDGEGAFIRALEFNRIHCSNTGAKGATERDFGLWHLNRGNLSTAADREVHYAEARTWLETSQATLAGIDESNAAVTRMKLRVLDMHEGKLEAAQTLLEPDLENVWRTTESDPTDANAFHRGTLCLHRVQCLLAIADHVAPLFSGLRARHYQTALAHLNAMASWLAAVGPEDQATERWCWHHLTASRLAVLLQAGTPNHVLMNAASSTLENGIRLLPVDQHRRQLMLLETAANTTAQVLGIELPDSSS